MNNTKGVLRVGVPASRYDAATWDALMHTNVRAPALVTAAFWPLLARPTGMVVNIGSTTETFKLAQAFHSLCKYFHYSKDDGGDQHTNIRHIHTYRLHNFTTHTQIRCRRWR